MNATADDLMNAASCVEDCACTEGAHELAERLRASAQTMRKADMQRRTRQRVVARHRRRRNITHDEWYETMRVIKLFADAFNIDTRDIIGPRRVKQFSIARHLCMFVMRKHLHMSLTEIGKHFGNRDHTTVMYAIDNAVSIISSSSNANNIVNTIVTTLNFDNKHHAVP